MSFGWLNENNPLKPKVAKSPAAFPVTTVNGENVAPGYNTVPVHIFNRLFLLISLSKLADE